MVVSPQTHVFQFLVKSISRNEEGSYSSSRSPAKTQNPISYLLYSTHEGKEVDIKILLAQVLDLQCKAEQLQASGHAE